MPSGVLMESSEQRPSLLEVFRDSSCQPLFVQKSILTYHLINELWSLIPEREREGERKRVREKDSRFYQTYSWKLEIVLDLFRYLEAERSVACYWVGSNSKNRV